MAEVRYGPPFSASGENWRLLTQCEAAIRKIFKVPSSGLPQEGLLERLSYAAALEAAGQGADRHRRRAALRVGSVCGDEVAQASCLGLPPQAGSVCYGSTRGSQNRSLTSQIFYYQRR
jgi:hypothetical protein